MTAAASSSSPPIFRPSLWVEPPRHSTTVPVDSPTVSNVQHIDAILRPFIRTRQRTAVDLCTTQPRLAPGRPGKPRRSDRPVRSSSSEVDPEAFGGYMPALIRQYLGGLDDVDQAEADAWLADLKALDAGGAYSFAVLQFCFTATRPAMPRS
jgi:hypothetical protein